MTGRDFSVAKLLLFPILAGRGCFFVSNFASRATFVTLLVFKSISGDWGWFVFQSNLKLNGFAV